MNRSWRTSSNHSTNQVRKRNQEREIRRHYADPAALRLTHPVNAEAYQAVMLPLSRDNAILDFQAKRYGVARAGFQRVLRARTDDALARTYLGMISLASSDQPGRIAEAEAQFREAIRGDPQYPDAHRELGKLLASRKRNSEARDELRQYLHLAPADAGDRKDVEKAIRELS